jgi:NADH-quinone oxidoreductase subunit J
MTEFLFYVFAGLCLASATFAISRKNAVWAALWLVMMFFGLAGLFVLLEAWFVAAVQVIVYAGAIMVLFLFVIMLLDLRKEELAALAAPRFRPLGLAGAVLFLAVAGTVVWQSGDAFAAAPQGGPDGSAGAIGEALFRRWVLAFEVTSLLLLGAMLGAVILTKRRLT